MLKLMGFVLDFVNKGSKGVKEMTKDMKSMQKVHDLTDKALKRMSKSVGRYYNSMSAAVLEYKHDLVETLKGNTDVFGTLERVLGERVSSIIQMLATPESALAALGGAAIATGAAFDKTLTKIRGEIGNTAFDMADFGDIVKDTAIQMSAPFEQVSSAMAEFAKRGITSRSELEALTKTSIQFGHALQMSAQEGAAVIVQLRNKLKMTNDQIRDYMSGLLEVSKKTSIGREEILKSTYGMIDSIQKLQVSAQQAALGSTAVIAGALGETFSDASGFIEQIIEAAASKQSQAFRNLVPLASAGGQDVAAAFSDALNRQDIGAAFEALQESIRRLSASGDLESIKLAGKSFEQLFGMSMSTVDSLAKVSTGMADVSKNAFNLGKQSDNLKDFYDNIVSFGQQWYRVWEQLRDLLLPVGNILVAILKKVGFVIEVVLSLLNKLMDLPIIGTLVALAGVFLTTAIAIKGLAAALFVLQPVLPILTGSFALLSKTLSTIWISLGFVANAVTVLTASLYSLGAALVRSVLSGLSSVIASVYALSAALLTNPITWVVLGIVAAVTVLGVVVSKVFGSLSNFADWLSKSIANVYDGLRKILTLGGSLNWLAGLFGGASSSVVMPRTAGSITGAPPKKMAEGGIVSPRSGGTTVTVAEAGESEAIAPLSDLTGLIKSAVSSSSHMDSEAIVDALYDVADMFMTLLKRNMNRQELSPVNSFGQTVVYNTKDRK